MFNNKVLSALKPDKYCCYLVEFPIFGYSRYNERIINDV